VPARDRDRAPHTAAAVLAKAELECRMAKAKGRASLLPVSRMVVTPA